MTGESEYLRARDIARLAGGVDPDCPTMDRQADPRLGEDWRRTIGGQERA
jgi:hypothetical protein